MLHLLNRKTPVNVFPRSLSRLPMMKAPWQQPQRIVPWYRRDVWILIVVVLNLAATFLPAGTLRANDEGSAEPLRSPEDRKVLQQIQTILVTGSVQTWLDVPAPPYNVGVVLKLKLEDAGFQVIFDPNQPHDANLRIQYEEIPSGKFQVLEQGTAIRYGMRLVHERLGQIFSRQFDAEPNEIPVGSLYWDTISNLEEDPSYCFVGDLIQGHILRGQKEQDILLEVLLRPYTQPDRVNAAGSRGASQATVQQRARLNIIQELGQGPFSMPEAQEALWTVAKKAPPNERGAAMTQMGRIGDPSFLAPLAELLENEGNPEVRSAGEHAMSLIQSR